eukprot:11210151-Lingulodinium_polyedra.AAC.1
MYDDDADDADGADAYDYAAGVVDMYAVDAVVDDAGYADGVRHVDGVDLGFVDDGATRRGHARQKSL